MCGGALPKFSSWGFTISEGFNQHLIITTWPISCFWYIYTYKIKKLQMCSFSQIFQLLGGRQWRIKKEGGGRLHWGTKPKREFTITEALEGSHTLNSARGGGAWRRHSAPARGGGPADGLNKTTTKTTTTTTTTTTTSTTNQKHWHDGKVYIKPLWRLWSGSVLTETETTCPHHL